MDQVTVLDASILLAYFDDDDPHSEDAAEILLSDRQLAIGTVTLAESLAIAARDGRVGDRLADIREREVQEVALAPGSASQLAFLRVGTGLRMPDCCVLLAALSTYAWAIATRDDQLRAAAAGLGFETP